MSNRLLLVSPFFYPEPLSTGKYSSHLVQELVRKRAKVDVLCFHPLYPEWHPRRCSEGMPGVGIFRGGAWLRFPKKSLLRRAVLEFGFLLYILRHAGRIKQYSRIVAVLPPMLFLLVVLMAKGPRAKLSVIVHDLQGVMAGIGIRKGRRSLVRLVRVLERSVLRRCRRLVVLSSEMACFLSETYKIPEARISICKPFVTIDARNTRRRLGCLFTKGKKHIVYAGALGEKQNPKALIAFFRALVSWRSDIVCHVFSGGPIFESLRSKFEMRNDRLMFHSLVPEQDLYELYERSHVQVIPEKPGFESGALPSKLPNILASGVPILYVGRCDSDVCRIIQRAQAGLCTDSWDSEILKQLISQLLLEGEKRSHAERRKVFKDSLSPLFSTEPLIREIYG